MPDLDVIVGPITGASETEMVSDILPNLYAQHPTPLVVMRDDTVVGSVDLDCIIPSFGNLDGTPVSAVMHPVGTVDSGQTMDAVAREMTGKARAVVVTHRAGGIFSSRTEPVGILSSTDVLVEISKNVIDKAPMKILSGHRDMGFNVPISPCQRNCPIKQDIATYIDYVSQGRYVDSWSVIRETNPFPSILGRICNHPCETDCKRGWDPGEEPVTIRSIKRFSTDFAFKQGLWMEHKIAPSKGKKVAIVGGGR